MKFLRVFFVLCLLPTFLLQAESEIRMKGVEKRVSNLETHHNKPLNQITPCAGPRVKEGLDLALFADFIYWTARLDTLSYAKTGMADGNIVPATHRGEVQTVDWTWDPGFKVGLGWSFCHGCWDMLLQYTWFYTNVGDKKHSVYLQPGFEILTPAFDVFALLMPLEKAHAHFDLHYQVGDLELGRNYYVSRTLKLRPFVGIKGTWQKQDYNVFYQSLFVQQNVSPPGIYQFKTRFDHSLWGIGMRAGIKTAWQFSKIFSLYGNIALTGIYSHYNTGRKDTFQPFDQNLEPINPEMTTVNIHDRLRLIKPVMEFEIGLRAETYLSCGRYHFLFQAGWESHIWINQTLYISLNNNYDRFDLNLQGLTAKARFDF